MKEREGLVTLQGNPVVLIGNGLKAGDAAPDFEVVANNLQPAKFSDFKGKPLIVLSVPSLDTPVCDMETRRFNKEAASLGDVRILVISTDLPFAQKRWCGAAGVEAVQTLSDHRDTSFGTAFGVLIKGLRLLARAAFVIDKSGIIRYAEIVKEIADEPDYAAIIAEAKKIV